MSDVFVKKVLDKIAREHNCPNWKKFEQWLLTSACMGADNKIISEELTENKALITHIKQAVKTSSVLACQDIVSIDWKKIAYKIIQEETDKSMKVKDYKKALFFSGKASGVQDLLFAVSKKASNDFK